MLPKISQNTIKLTKDNLKGYLLKQMCNLEGRKAKHV